MFTVTEEHDKKPPRHNLDQFNLKQADQVEYSMPPGWDDEPDKEAAEAVKSELEEIPEARASEPDHAIEEIVFSQICSDAGLLSTALDVGISTEHFSDKRLAEVFRLMVQQHHSGEHVDFLTATLEASDQGKIDEAEFSTLTDIARREVSTVSARSNFGELKRRSAKRKAAAYTQKAGLYLSDGNRQKAIELLQKADEIEESGRDKSDSSAMIGEVWGAIPAFYGDLPSLDLDQEPTQSNYRAFLKDVPIAEDGDLVPITARLKSFKTTVCNALAASIVAAEGVDCLGLKIRGDGCILIFDTEQSEKDILVQAKAIRQRLRVSKTPDRIKVFSLRELKPQSRLAVIRQEIDRYQKDGISAVIVDGATDLGGSVNDDENATVIVNFLTVAASKARAPLFACVHLNHADRDAENGGRGHLGKELERKGKTVLCIEKDRDGIGTIYANETRQKPIPKNEGQRIAYSDQAGMVVSLDETLGDVQLAAKVEGWTRELQSVQAQTQMLAWKHSDLKREIEKAADVKDRAARNRIKAWLDAGLLRHDANRGVYTSTLDTAPDENGLKSIV